MQDVNALSWFEIPATDLARASRFYAAVLGKPLREEKFGPSTLHVFPYDEPGVGGALMQQDGMVPSRTGTLVYLRTPAPLADAIGRVRAAGGAVVLDRTPLPKDLGVIAHVIDTEGNQVGLHAAT
jgi:hypothetical protein